MAINSNEIRKVWHPQLETWVWAGKIESSVAEFSGAEVVGRHKTRDVDLTDPSRGVEIKGLPFGIFVTLIRQGFTFDTGDQELNNEMVLCPSDLYGRVQGTQRSRLGVLVPSYDNEVVQGVYPDIINSTAGQGDQAARKFPLAMLPSGSTARVMTCGKVWVFGTQMRNGINYRESAPQLENGIISKYGYGAVDNVGWVGVPPVKYHPEAGDLWLTLVELNGLPLYSPPTPYDLEPPLTNETPDEVEPTP